MPIAAQPQTERTDTGSGTRSKPGLILYDGLCGFCSSSVQFVIRRDPFKRFQFASLQSPVGKSVLTHLGLPCEDITTFVLVTEQGYWTKSTAALKVLKHLQGWWPLLYGFIAIPVRLRDTVYDWVARNRYRILGQHESCYYPTTDIRERFIDGGMNAASQSSNADILRSLGMPISRGND